MLWRCAIFPRCLALQITLKTGVPCQNCRTAGTPCTLTARDRNIVVSEAYIQRLEAMAHLHREILPSLTLDSADEPSNQRQGTSNQATALSPSGSHENRVASLTFKHATAEAFVSGLKRLSVGDYAGFPYLNQVPPAGSFSAGSTEISKCDYASLRFDASCT
jgi:hypothetical protein